MSTEETAIKLVEDVLEERGLNRATGFELRDDGTLYNTDGYVLIPAGQMVSSRWAERVDYNEIELTCQIAYAFTPDRLYEEGIELLAETKTIMRNCEQINVTLLMAASVYRIMTGKASYEQVRDGRIVCKFPITITYR